MFKLHMYLGGSQFLFFLLLITSCNKQHTPWSITKVETKNPQYDSSRYVYTDKNARFELYTTATEIFGYFSVTSLPISPLPDDSSKSRIILTIGSEEEEVIAHRLSGGQKLLLPETTLIKILSGMKRRETITMKTSRYSLTISPLPQQEFPQSF